MLILTENELLFTCVALPQLSGYGNPVKKKRNSCRLTNRIKTRLRLNCATLKEPTMNGMNGIAAFSRIHEKKFD